MRCSAIVQGLQETLHRESDAQIAHHAVLLDCRPCYPAGSRTYCVEVTAGMVQRLGAADGAAQDIDTGSGLAAIAASRGYRHPF